MPFQIPERNKQLRRGSKSKFSYFEKAKKFENNFHLFINTCQNKNGDFHNFLGLFIISKLFLETIHVIFFNLLIEFVHTLVRTFTLFDRMLSSVRSH
jgi:hypothetical protein